VSPLAVGLSNGTSYYGDCTPITQKKTQEWKSQVGKLSFGVLLMQDIAVPIPILAILPLLVVAGSVAIGAE